MMKRFFDFTCGLIGLIVLSPVFLLCMLWVALDSRGPVLFHQRRVGRGGALFNIHKFRTMRIDSEVEGQLTVQGDSRVTRSGRYLRKWKLDELPQLWNVLVGEMSLVGPRPEVPRYVSLYTPEQRRILEVRPGMTDLASIEFMDENALLARMDDPEVAYIQLILPRKLALNREYLDRGSILFDAWIILKTVGKIFIRSEATIPSPTNDLDAKTNLGV